MAGGMASADDSEQASRQRAERFRRVRDAHQTEMAEDYVELIADLIERKGEARVVDLAERLGVTKATVNNTIQRLQRDGLVTQQALPLDLPDRARARRWRPPRARATAWCADFLIALGVDAETADADAEGIEHHVSDATLEAFRGYLKKARPPG